MIEVRVDDSAFQRAVERFKDHLRGTRRPMTVAGRGLRDYVKETIRMGGRPAWPPLSKWTIARTRRTKPLGNMQKYISFEASATGARVFARETGEDWSVDQHHTGWYIPPREAPIMVTKKPDGRGKTFFRKAEGAYVPPRPIWPTRREVEKVVVPTVQDWLKEGARKWR